MFHFRNQVKFLYRTKILSNDTKFNIFNQLVRKRYNKYNDGPTLFMTTVVEDFDCIYLIPIIALISIKIICVASRKNKKQLTMQ